MVLNIDTNLERPAYQKELEDLSTRLRSQGFTLRESREIRTHLCIKDGKLEWKTPLLRLRREHLFLSFERLNQRIVVSRKEPFSLHILELFGKEFQRKVPEGNSLEDYLKNAILDKIPTILLQLQTSQFELTSADSNLPTSQTENNIELRKKLYRLFSNDMTTTPVENFPPSLLKFKLIDELSQVSSIKTFCGIYRETVRGRFYTQTTRPRMFESELPISLGFSIFHKLEIFLLRFKKPFKALEDGQLHLSGNLSHLDGEFQKLIQGEESWNYLLEDSLTFSDVFQNPTQALILIQLLKYLRSSYLKKSRIPGVPFTGDCPEFREKLLLLSRQK